MADYHCQYKTPQSKPFMSTDALDASVTYLSILNASQSRDDKVSMAMRWALQSAGQAVSALYHLSNGL